MSANINHLDVPRANDGYGHRRSLSERIGKTISTCTRIRTPDGRRRSETEGSSSDVCKNEHHFRQMMAQVEADLWCPDAPKKDHSFKHLREVGVTHGEGHACGTLLVAIVGASVSASKPYFIVELDGNEECTKSRTACKSWLARYELPVYDPSSDLCLLLCDASKKGENAVGRVIVPIRHLCTDGFLPKAKPSQRIKYKIMPIARLCSTDLEVKYKEAIPYAHRSGMATPTHDLGTVEVILKLTFHNRFGLLGAYAHSDVKPAIPSKLETVRIEDVSMTTKSVKAIINCRMKRCCRIPHLLHTPYVYLLPFVWFGICFYAKPFVIPWIFCVLLFFNGWLENHAEETKDMIFWEHQVGDSLPGGLDKLKRLNRNLRLLQEKMDLGASILEKQMNLFNFSNPPVSIVAFGFLTILSAFVSLALFLVPLHILVFVTGLLGLVPCAKGSDETSKHSKTFRVVKTRSLPPPFQALYNILSQVPDGKDVAHEYFASSQILNTAKPLEGCMSITNKDQTDHYKGCEA